MRPRVGDVQTERAYREAITKIETGDPSVASVAFVAPHETEANPIGWPQPDPRVFHGVLGHVVRQIAPHSEADPVAIAVHLLLGFGNIVGRRPHFKVEADEHHLNEFALLVGATSTGRKGTAAGYMLRILGPIDEEWADARVQSGLSSGEGLISAVMDEIKKQEPIRQKGRITGYQPVIVDAGISDKRLFVLQSEFASTLKVMTREGNTLSPIIRQAWDSGNLRVMTKLQTKATGAHISIVGHITSQELRRRIDETELANGFLNRFMLFAVRRAQYLPEGGGLVDFVTIAGTLDGKVKHARNVDEMKRDDEARELWAKVYPELSNGPGGLLRDVTSRAEPHVMRCACLYALFDGSDTVRRKHLEAGVALWDYSAQSAAFVFGQALGNRTADQALAALIEAGQDGMDRTSIRDHFGRHAKAHEVNMALRLLAEQGLADVRADKTGGRPREVWSATKATKATKGGLMSLLSQPDTPWKVGVA